MEGMVEQKDLRTLLPPDHPARMDLNNEVHARPPEELVAPCSISYLAIIADEGGGEEAWRQVAALARRFCVDPPKQGAKHFSASLGPFRIKLERHTEFVRYKFIVERPEGAPFSEPAIARVPEDWLKGLTGRILVATNIMLMRDEPPSLNADEISNKYFGGNMLAGAFVANKAARAFTDFRVHAGGFGRLLVLDYSTTPRQAGRLIQRLVEIDTYRMLALLALPVAQGLSPFLAECESELAQVTGSMVKAGVSAEPELLGRFMELEAAIESQISKSHYRMSAAAAYWQLVQRRIAELREERIEGLQTFREFMERRLAPAMNTCVATAGRLQTLSSTVANATQLLSTKVDIALEQQNQAVLASMDRRAKMQLRLQQTVEGLSIAAVTYYVAGLVGYAAKALKAAGVAVNPDVAMGIAIPFAGAIVAYGIHRVRESVSEPR